MSSLQEEAGQEERGALVPVRQLQQQCGLPHIHTPGMNRYRISEVETWLREQYG